MQRRPLLLWLGLSVSSFVSGENTAKKEICKTGAYSQDKDPNGTNIRSGPKGKILGQIPDETIFSVIGYQDEWFEVREFEYYLDSDWLIEYAKRNKHKIEGDIARIPKLKGWIHRNHVTFHFGGRLDANLYAQPDENSKLLFRIKGSDQEDNFKVLACKENGTKLSSRDR